MKGGLNVRFSRHRSALAGMVLALTAALLAAVPAQAAGDCPSGQTQFKIDKPPSNGTYGDGTLSVTISNADSDSFSWSTNIEVESVMVKAGTSLKENPGGTSGSASSATNPSNGKPYGISHVSFCYDTASSSGSGGSGDSADGKNDDVKSDDAKDDDCPDKDKSNGKGNMPAGCEEVESEGTSRDDDCPEKDNGQGGGKGNMPEGCEDGDDVRGDRDDDESLIDECPDGDDGATGNGGMDEDCGEEDETLGDVTTQPANPNDGGNPAGGGGNAPETDVLGIRTTNQGRVGASTTAAQVQGQQGPGAETLPRTGLALVPYLLAGFGLIAMGAVMRRRRSGSESN